VQHFLLDAARQSRITASNQADLVVFQSLQKGLESFVGMEFGD